MSRGWQDIPLPDDLRPQVLVWRWFAKMYGFTPDQVDQLPLDALTWFPIVEEAAEEAQKRITQQEMRATQQSHGRR